MKSTLFSRRIPFVERHLVDGVILQSSYKHIINNIHTAAVAKHVCDSGPNAVLGVWPPSVSKTESTLPHSTRCVLRQLRSVKCKLLRTYTFWIGKSDSDTCPEC
jgi:hypothetical protein